MNLPEDLARILQIREQSSSQLTLVTGVFDVLHNQHHQFLIKAKKLAKILVIGLESDRRVQELKGEGRPVNLVTKRKENLQQWGIADVIFVLPPSFGQASVRHAWLQAIRPDFLAVSSHTRFLTIKKKEMKDIGGQVKVVHQFNPQVSSSKLINKVQKQQASGSKLISEAKQKTVNNNQYKKRIISNDG